MVITYSGDGHQSHQAYDAGTVVWTVPFQNIRYFDYDAAVQTLKMTDNPNEGIVKGPDATPVQDKNGVQLSINSTTWFKVVKDDSYTVYSQHPGDELTSKDDNAVDTTVAGVVVRPILQAAIQVEVSKYGYNQLPELKLQMMKNIKDAVTSKLKGYGLTLVDFSLGNPIYPQSLQDSLNKTAQAQADLQVSATKIDIAKNDALALVAQAKGQAQQLEIIRLELAKDPNLVQIYQIDKWDGHGYIITDG